MRKYAFISDLHGNTEALSVVMDDIRRRGVEDIFCLGDVIGYGPEPRECLQVVIESCRLCLLGNHEHGAMFYASDFNPKARAAIEWTKDQLNDSSYSREDNFRLWNYISEMPEAHEMDGILLVHGSPRDPVREYLLPADAHDQSKMSGCFAKMGKAQMCFVGHSHVPGVYEEGGWFKSPGELGGSYELDGKRVMVNIGSVGQPRDGDPRASYVTLEGDTIHFHRLAYDVEATMAKVRATELPDYLADRLAVGR